MKEFTVCSPKTYISKVAQLVNENSCEELIVATRISLHKAGEKKSEVVSMVHSQLGLK